jgi:hypothetical protein
LFGLNALRLETVEPFRKRYPFVVVLITVARHLLAAPTEFPTEREVNNGLQSADKSNSLCGCHEFSESFPFPPLPNFVFVLVQQNEAQSGNLLVFGAPFRVVST